MPAAGHSQGRLRVAPLGGYACTQFDQRLSLIAGPTVTEVPLTALSLDMLVRLKGESNGC